MRLPLLLICCLLLAACKADAPPPPPPGAPTLDAASGEDDPDDPDDEDAARAQAPRRPGKRDRPADAGWWRRFRTHRLDPSMSPEQRAELEALEAIGYVGGSVEGAGPTGVVRNRADKVWGGLNFYTSGHAPEALLMDNDGRVRHRWSADFDALWPDYPVRKNHNSRSCWRRAHLFPNGDVVAIFGGLGMVRLDRESKVLWALPNRAHHDLDVAPDGDIVVLTREAHVVPRVDPKRPVLEDFVVVLGPDGVEKDRLSVLEAFENSAEYAAIWQRKTQHRGDLFHTNSVEVLDGSLAAALPAFRAGNILISCRANHTIAVVDLEKRQVVWAHHGGEDRAFRRQHDPSVLDNGHLLLFDNKDAPGRSAVEEYDPVSMKQVWSYRGGAADPFYSATCGAAERLPNGNTMVTESDNGRAFEVDGAGEIVWEFLNPARAGAEGEYIAALFEVRRLAAGFGAGWLEPAAP